MDQQEIGHFLLPTDVTHIWTYVIENDIPGQKKPEVTDFFSMTVLE